MSEPTRQQTVSSDTTAPFEERANVEAALAYPETEWSSPGTLTAFRAAFAQGYLKACQTRCEADHSAPSSIPVETDLDQHRKPDVIWQDDAEQAIRDLDAKAAHGG